MACGLHTVIVQYNYNDITPVLICTVGGILTVFKNICRCVSVVYVTVTIPTLSPLSSLVQCHVDDILQYKSLNGFNLYLKHFKLFGSPFKCTIGATLELQTFRPLYVQLVVLCSPPPRGLLSTAQSVYFVEYWVLSLESGKSSRRRFVPCVLSLLVASVVFGSAVSVVDI